MHRLILHAISAALLLALLSGCSLLGDSAWNGIHAGANLGYQRVDLEGTIETTTEVSPGVFVTTDFDLEDNAGIDDSESALYASARVGLAPLELRASVFEYSNEASGTFTGDFLGTTFSGPVDTDFDILAYKATLGFDLINLERFRIGGIIGATVLDMDFTVTSSAAPGTAETLDEVIPAPIVGARADLKIIDSIRVGGEFSLIPLSEIEDFDVDFTDWEIGIHFEPFPYLEIFALMRDIRLDVEGDIDGSDAAVDIGIHGPVVGVGITF